MMLNGYCYPLYVLDSSLRFYVSHLLDQLDSDRVPCIPDPEARRDYTSPKSTPHHTVVFAPWAPTTYTRAHGAPLRTVSPPGTTPFHYRARCVVWYGIHSAKCSVLRDVAWYAPTAAAARGSAPEMGLTSLHNHASGSHQHAAYIMASMREWRISFTIWVGCASLSLNTDSITCSSVAVVSSPQKAIQSLAAMPAEITSLPRFTVPATSGTCNSDDSSSKSSMEV
mmetsp:Transcript_3340/g.6945  ORF Transcript_3340/g.6945 Transcript_3340/m.6945 type:complete len:225 (+) Transcript_3340:174-848(+)